MDAVSPAFSALAIVSILAVTGLLAVIEKRVTRGDLARIVLVAGVGGSIVALAGFLEMLQLPRLLFGPVVALGALFATLATSLLDYESTPRRLALSAASTALDAATRRAYLERIPVRRRDETVILPVRQIASVVAEGDLLVGLP